jgi:hypothetical protein
MSRKNFSKLNLIGQKFGKLTPIKDVILNRGRSACICKCECGNEITVTKSALLNNKTVSCGCKRSEKANRYKDLIGEKINKWTVLGLEKNNKNYIAICKCECGNTSKVNIYNLINNKSKDCGCGRKKTLSSIKSGDLCGKKYGKLQVVKKLENTSKNNRIIYVCKCDCGNIVEVESNRLVTNHTTSCGCLGSSNNLKIEKILKDKNEDYQREYLINIDNHNLRFDFYLPQYNLVIEYDGEQHYSPINFCGNAEKAKLNYERTKKYDQLKNDYCKINNINLLRIPYWEKENIETIIIEHLQRLSEKGRIFYGMQQSELTQ